MSATSEGGCRWRTVGRAHGDSGARQAPAPSPRRVFNFGPGPCGLPTAVVLRAQAELPDYGGIGASVMEIPHRGPVFRELCAGIVARVRRLLGVGEEYHVLLLAGGARGQAAGIPLNLLGGRRQAAYLVTGHWSRLALDEGRRFCEALVPVDTSPSHRTVPEADLSGLDPGEVAYLHYADNETIQGVEFQSPPEAPVPLVADMTSNIFSRPVDGSRFGLVYASAQKNLGPPGVTLVVVREDLARAPRADTPLIWRYAEQARRGSMMNTPPMFEIYMLGLMLDWIGDRGGIPALERANREKAAMLYGAIDASGFYANGVDPAFRSRMNVPFTLADPRLDDEFVRLAEEADLFALRGHASVGGMRASIYNAMPAEGVRRLVDFMREFERARA